MAYRKKKPMTGVALGAKARSERIGAVFLWTVIGLGGGTALLAPFVMSSDRREKTIGGMIVGGVPGALVGYVYGKRKSRQTEGDP